MFVSLTFLLFASIVVSETVTRFTNIQCEVLDSYYCSFMICELRVLGRGIVGLNVHEIIEQSIFMSFLLGKTNNLSFEKIIVRDCFWQIESKPYMPYDVSSLKIIFYVYWLLFNFYSMTWYFAILLLRKSISSISRYLPVSIRYKLKPAPTTSGKPM